MICVNRRQLKQVTWSKSYQRPLSKIRMRTYNTTIRSARSKVAKAPRAVALEARGLGLVALLVPYSVALINKTWGVYLALGKSYLHVSHPLLTLGTPLAFKRGLEKAAEQTFKRFADGVIPCFPAINHHSKLSEGICPLTG